MSLTIKRTVNIIGDSKIDGVTASRYTATIDSQKPENVNYVTTLQNKDLYKENRDICHQDQAEFEDIMYQIQDDMINREATTEETVDDIVTKEDTTDESIDE